MAVCQSSLFADPPTPPIVALLIMEVLLNNFFATIIVRIVTRKGASIIAFKRCVGAARRWVD